MYGNNQLMGIYRWLLCCVVVFVGGPSLKAACACTYGAYIKPAYAVHVFDDVGTLQSSASGTGTGPVCITVVNSPPPVYPLHVKKQASPFTEVITITQADANACNTNSIAQGTNYSRNFCITNTWQGHRYLAPHWIDNVTGVRTDLADPFKAWVPGEGACYIITNSNPFTVIWGDGNPGSDDVLTQLQSATNTFDLPGPGNTSQLQANNTPANVGNPNSPYSGTNAIGGTNALNQLQYNQGVEALLAAQGSGVGRLEAWLSQIASNTANDGEIDYSGLLGSIKTNTADTRMSLTNRDAGDLSNATNASSRATNYSLSILSNLVGGTLIGNLGFAGAGTNLSLANYGANLVTTPSANFGSHSLTNAGVVVGTIDLGSAMDMSMFDVLFGGAGWRSWWRVTILWLIFIAVMLSVLAMLRESVVDAAHTPEFNVGANATGAGALFGGNTALRPLMIPLLVAMIAMVPGFVVVAATTILTLLNNYSGSLPTSIPDALSYGASGSPLSGIPTIFKMVLYKINVSFPLVESAIIAGNYIVVRLLIEPLRALTAIFVKIYGV